MFRFLGAFLAVFIAKVVFAVPAERHYYECSGPAGMHNEIQLTFWNQDSRLTGRIDTADNYDTLSLLSSSENPQAEFTFKLDTWVDDLDGSFSLTVPRFADPPKLLRATLHQQGRRHESATTKVYQCRRAVPPSRAIDPNVVAEVQKYLDALDDPFFPPGKYLAEKMLKGEARKEFHHQLGEWTSNFQPYATLISVNDVPYIVLVKAGEYESRLWVHTFDGCYVTSAQESQYYPFEWNEGVLLPALKSSH